MNSAPKDPLIGQTLDERYVVRSRIARGGMAMVYLGDDLRLGREVAIKAMHPHLADDENFLRRFEQEARSAAGLGHPNVVNVFDQGVANHVPYLVMEYLPGITLRDLLKQQGKLTPEQALEIGEAVLAGLTAAHGAGIVHRDLKPENVLLADDGRIKIGDFGLARAVSANTTTGQALLGTIAYLSPELVTRGIADERSDLYAFGIMMFEMLTGKQPYTGDQPMQIAYQHAHSDVPAPSSLEPSISPEIDELVLWCTRREAEHRPNNASQALQYIRALNNSDTQAATAVLGATRVLTGITPSTTLLTDVEQELLAESVTEREDSHDPDDPITVAQRVGVRRAQRGRILAGALVLLIAFAGGAGWWWGQGPGALVTIPQVAGLEMTKAQALLSEASLLVDVFECPSLDVEVGLAVTTEPEPGSRVEQGATVRLCQSTGPQALAMPVLTGLSLKDAEKEIEKAGFTFGEVVEQRFSDAPRDTVISAVDSSGATIGETFAEKGVVNLVMSAGALPTVEGLSEAKATSTLQGVGVKVDPALNSSAHSDTIEKGQVIQPVFTGETVKVGDAVGLVISLGPELFPVPDVIGKNIREAVASLEAAGFAYEVSAGSSLWDQARVSRTEPAAGTEIAKGETVTIRWELFG